MEEIFEKIKNERRKKGTKFLLIGLACMFFALLCSAENADDGLTFWIPTAILFVIALKHYLSSTNVEENKLFYRLNKIGTPQEISDFFEQQINKKIIEDEKVIVTPKLFIIKNKYEDTLINEDILDITHFVHKSNSIIDYISIKILYNDGKVYEIKYNRPLGISDMESKSEAILNIVNVLAENCDNLRKRRNNIKSETRF